MPLKMKGTFAALSNSSGVSVVTLHRALKRGDLKSESRRPKPLLTVQNRFERVQWSLSFVNQFNSSRPYYCMLNCVHVDEKWFYIMQMNGRVIIIPGEQIQKV